MDNIVEKFVCNSSDIDDNDKKVFDLDDGAKVLIIKENDQIYASGTKCSHFGAPLVNGIVNNGNLRCPWHGAEFNLSTGDIEDFPAYGCLPVYQVQLKGDQIWIKAKAGELAKNKAELAKCIRDSNSDQRTFVIIGGGAAGFQCSETLRQKGFTGRLVLITAEDALPYDRTKLSKILDSKLSALLLRDEEYYKSASIEILKGKKVTKLDHRSKKIFCNDVQLNYDKVFLATGVYPRRYYLPGSDLKNIFYLRNVMDANKIIETAIGKNVVVVGSSFIGMEVAANLVGKASSVCVVGRSNVPFKTLFSNEIGAKLKEFYESKGVEFHLKCQVKKFLGKDAVEEVVITGKTLKADMVVLGIGAEADVAYLENSGISFAYYNNVVVNNRMETSIPDIYAGGDMVAFNLGTYENKLVNIGHWQIAQMHGKTAALNMLGKTTELHTVPFFYSMMFGKGLRMAGYTDKIDDVFISGNLDVNELKFVAFHFKDNKVVSVVTMSYDPIASYFATLLKDGKVLKKEDIKKDPLAWAKHVLN